MDSRYKPSGINFFNSAVTCQKFFNKPLTLQRTGHQWRFEKENNSLRQLFNQLLKGKKSKEKLWLNKG